MQHLDEFGNPLNKCLHSFSVPSLGSAFLSFSANFSQLVLKAPSCLIWIEQTTRFRNCGQSSRRKGRKKVGQTTF